MGNSIFFPYIQRRYAGGGRAPVPPFVKLVFWEGTTKVLRGTSRHSAGEIMVEFPEKMVCHADSFFIGQPIPALGSNDELVPGHTYFVLPVEPFAWTLLSTSTLGCLIRSNPSKGFMKFGECPFQYLKGSDGRVMIKVMPEFLTAVINRGKESSTAGSSTRGGHGKSSLCSTPELQKHYRQLVASKEHGWSPKLETISEYKIDIENRISKKKGDPYRVSVCGCMRVEWTMKE